MEKIKETLNRLWQGDVPLSHTFWLYYCVGIMVLRIFAGAAGSVFGIVIVAWAGFMVMPIWRSADKYSGNKTFSLLAKIAAVVIALGVLGSLFA